MHSPIFSMPELEEKYLNMFRELYRKKEGKDLLDIEVVEKFNKLIVLIKSVYLPIPKSNKKEFIKLLWQTTNAKK